MKWSTPISKAIPAIAVVLVALPIGLVFVAHPRKPQQLPEFQERGPYETVTPAAGQRFQFDFGVTKPEVAKSHRFDVLNDSSQTWKVTGAKTSCRCTEAELGVKLVPPGDLLVVTVHYRAPGQTHKRDRQWAAVSVDGRTEPLLFEVIAKVVSDIEVSPETCRIQISDDRPKTAFVTVDNYSAEDWDLPRIETDVDWLSVGPVHLVESGFDSRQRWTFCCRVEASDLQRPKQVAKLEVHAGKNAKPAHLTLIATKIEPLGVFPSRVMSEVTSHHATVRKSFTVVSESDYRGQIDVSHDLPANLSVTWSGEGRIRNADIEITPFETAKFPIQGEFSFSSRVDSPKAGRATVKAVPITVTLGRAER